MSKMNGMELHDFFLVEFVVHGLFFLFVTAGVVGHGRGLLCHFHFFVVTWLAFNHTAATTEHGGLHEYGYGGYLVVTYLWSWWWRMVAGRGG